MQIAYGKDWPTPTSAPCPGVPPGKGQKCAGGGAPTAEWYQGLTCAEEHDTFLEQEQKM